MYVKNGPSLLLGTMVYDGRTTKEETTKKKKKKFTNMKYHRLFSSRQHDDGSHRRRCSISITTCIMILLRMIITCLLPIDLLLLDTVVATPLLVQSSSNYLYQEQPEQVRKQQQQRKRRRLALGDFDTLNERWMKEGIMIPIAPMTIEKDVLTFPLTLNIQNGTCQSISIGDIEWVWEEQQQPDRSTKIFHSNFTILNFAIGCTLDLSWTYTFVETSSGAYVGINNSNIETAFTLVAPSNEVMSSDGVVLSSSSLSLSPSSGFNFTFDTCQANMNVEELSFTLTSPTDVILNVLLKLVKDSVSNQLEEGVCRIVQQLESRFRTLLSNLTDTFLVPPSSQSTSNDNPFVQYEDTMVVIIPPTIQLVDFQTISTTNYNNDYSATGPTNSRSSVGHFLDSFRQFSGVSILISDSPKNESSIGIDNNNNNNNEVQNGGTTESWTNWLLPQGSGSSSNTGGGLTVDLTDNMLLNGPDGFISTLTNPNVTDTSSANNIFASVGNNNNNTSSIDTTTSNGSSVLQEFFGIQQLRVLNITIIGLENVLSSFRGLKVIGNYTLELDLAIKNLQFIMNIELNRTTIPSSSTSTTTTTTTDTITNPATPSTEIIQVGFNTSNDATFRTGILVPINEEVLSSLQLGSFLYGSYTIINCLTSVLYDNELLITGVDATGLGLQGVSFDGLQSPGMDRILTTGLDYIFAALDDSFGQILSSLLTGVDLLSFVGRGGNNSATMTDPLLSQDSTTCPAPIQRTTEEFVDVRDLFLPPTEAVLYGGSGTEPYGNFTSGLLEQTVPSISNFLNFTTDRDLFNYTTKFTLGSAKRNRIEFVLSNFRFVNTGLRNDSTILGGILGEAFETKSFVSLKNLELGGNIIVAVEMDNKGFRSDIGITFTMEKFEVLLQVLSKLRTVEFLGLPITSILDLSCWLSIFSPPFLAPDNDSTNITDFSLALRKFSVLLEGINLDIGCVECPALLEKVVQRIAPLNYSNDAISFVDRIVTLVTVDKSMMIQSKIDELLLGAPMRCPSKPEFNQSLREPGFFAPIITAFAAPYVAESQPNDSNTIMKILIALVVIAVSLGLGRAVVNAVMQRIANKRFKAKLPTMQESEILAIAKEQMYEEMKQKQLDEYSGPLYKHPCVPKRARWLIPVILLLTSALFWCGLFAPFMAVQVFGQAGDEPSFLMVQIHYSLCQIATQYIQRKNFYGYLIFFIAVHPAQTRIITTLLMWYLPTSKVSYAKRGYWLTFFDSKQKIAMLVLFIAIIGASQYQGTIKTLPITIQFVTVPVWAVHMILLGEIFTIAVTRYVIRYHHEIANTFEAELTARQQVAPSNNTYEPNRNDDLVSQMKSSSTEASQDSQDKPFELYKSTFFRSDGEYSVELYIRRPVQYGYVIGCVIAMIFVLMGCTLSSFYYNISGLLGIAVDFGEIQDQDGVENNVFTIVQNLISSAQIIGDAKAYLGLGTIAILVVATVLVVPIIISLIQILRWVHPLTLTTQSRLRKTTRMLEFWNFCDVFFFGIIICSQQSARLSRIVASTYCKTFSNILRSLAYWGIIDETADVCVEVDSKVHPAIFFFLGVVLLLASLKGFLECVLEQLHNEEKAKTIMPDELKSVDRETLQKYVDNLKPPPVQFTDRFRWALYSEAKSIQT